ncbi:MAG: hypothetical protein N2512_12800 [Armatimonadetes bacterium]|nr:hypothetical protein [Armatimonadota bacterium]
MASFEEQELLDRLSDLQELPTVEWVSATLYEIGVNELLETNGARDRIGRVFCQLLDAELEYHGQLASLLERDEFRPRLLADLNRSRVAQLKRDLKRLAATSPRSLSLLGVREIALAQCHWSLGHTKRAVEHLEAAAASGVASPLLWLALGYARYEQAVQHFVLPRKPSPTAWTRFQQACLNAVRCFQAGLGGELDPQLYWWMGTVLAAAGFEKDALEAFEKAHTAEEEWIRNHGDDYSLDADTPYADLLDDLPRITVLDEDLLFEDPYESLDLEWPDGDDDELSQ